MPKRLTALDRLLAPMSAEAFLGGHWPDRHLVVHGPLSRLPHFFHQGGLSSFEALSNVYGGRLQIAGARGADHSQFSIQGAHPHMLKKIGLTVFFADDVNPYLPGAQRWIRELEAQLGAPVGSGKTFAFASPGSGGLDSHFDQSETFIVQLIGRKRLLLAPNTTYPTLQFCTGKPPAEGHYPMFSEGFPLQPPRTRFSVTLEPGSVLYLPRGMWHRTEAQGESFSASVSVDIPNAIDLLAPYLKLSLVQYLRWRRPLFGAWGSQRVSEKSRVKELLDELGRNLGSLNVDELLDSIEPEATRQLKIRPECCFQRIPTTRFAFGTHSGKPMLTVTSYEGAGEVQLSLGKLLVPVGKWIGRKRASFSVHELASAFPDIPLRTVTALLALLAEAEGVRQLTFSPLLQVRRKIRLSAS